MLDSLITSKMRLRILMRLFLNPESRAYLRELTGEFGASPGHVRAELRQLSEAGLLCAEQRGRQINYHANTGHPLFPELQSMVRKSLGMDRILDSIVERLGNLEAAFLIGDYAVGKDSGVIDLLLLGDVNKTNLEDLVRKTERYIERTIRVQVMDRQAYEALDGPGQPSLLLWSRSGDHDG